MLFSIVIPSAREYPRTLISALLAQSKEQEEIILVNDTTCSDENWLLDADSEPGSANPPAEHLADDRVRVLETAGDGGGAEARNIGWRAATNPWILFLDDDTSVTNHFLKQARKTICQNPATTVATYRVMTPQSTTSWARLSEKTLSLDRGSELRSTQQPLAIDNVWQYGVGAALAANRDLLLEIDGYKDKLGPGRPFGGIEDIELLWHASHHPGTITYDGTVRVKHQLGETYSEWRGKLRDYGQAIGHLAGAVDSNAAKRWMSGYCELLREATTTTIFDRLSSQDQVKAEAALNNAIEATHESYERFKDPKQEPIYLCETCR